MTRSNIMLAATTLAIGLTGAAFAQGTSTPPRPMPEVNQTIPRTTPAEQMAPRVATPTSVDPATVAMGERSSKIVGTSVVNEKNETVGTIDDLLLVTPDKAPVAVLSVGGFLGIGSKYVVVPFSLLEHHDKMLMLRGATKDSLKNLPEFKYAS